MSKLSTKLGGWLRRIPSRWWMLVLLTIAIEVVYMLIARAATWGDWPAYNANFDLQAEAFRTRRLHLLIKPDPNLLAAPDPFDPANSQWWIPDFSLYKGRYFLYWGPVPAILIAAIKVVGRIKYTVTDAVPQFIFYSQYLVAGVLFFERMARRLFPRLPFYWVVLAVLVYAFGNPTPYLIATPSVYLTAIVGGQAFLMTGLLRIFDAFWRGRDEGRLQPGLAVAAGASWVLGLGCRFSIAPAVFVLALLASLPARGRHRPWRAFVWNFSWQAAPVVVGTFFLLLYNKARFHEWLEFGQNYQLNTWHFHSAWAYVWPNVYSYLFRPMGHSCHFPFFTAIWNIGAKGFPASFHEPARYMISEPVVGILVGTPFSLLAIFGIGFGVRAAWMAARRPGGLLAADPATRAQMLCVFSGALLGSATAVATVAIFGTTIRYMGDVSAGILICASMGAWWIYLRLADRPVLRAVVTTAMIALAIFTIVVGALLGVTGYNDHLKRFNPDLFEKISAALSRCRG